MPFLSSLNIFFMGCIFYLSKSCSLFWDRAQNMLIFDRRCSTPLTTFKQGCCYKWTTLHVLPTFHFFISLSFGTSWICAFQLHITAKTAEHMTHSEHLENSWDHPMCSNVTVLENIYKLIYSRCVVKCSNVFWIFFFFFFFLDAVHCIMWCRCSMTNCLCVLDVIWTHPEVSGTIWTHPDMVLTIDDITIMLSTADIIIQVLLSTADSNVTQIICNFYKHVTQVSFH